MRWGRSEWGRVGVVLLSAVCAGCGPRAPRSPSPDDGPDDLVRRHWDQACSVNDREAVFVEVSELFDTLGLQAALGEVKVVPRPLAPPWPTVDFITRYAHDGTPTRMGVWEPTASPEVADEVERILSARVRALPSLLAPTGFRTMVIFAMRPRVATAGPVTCLPHMVHERGQRATGLPDTVGTWGGRMRVGDDNDSTAVVRIVVDAAGRVTQVEPIEGTESALQGARRVVAALRFEPALRNGEAVEGEFVQTFRFRRSRPPGGNEEESR